MLATATAAAAAPATNAVKVVSPDGHVAMTVAVRDIAGDAACLVYEVTYKGKAVVHASRLGLDLADAPPLGAGLAITGVERTTHDETWKPVYGERAEIPDRWRQAVVALRETAAPHRRLRVTVRVADEGAALRYTIPKQPGLDRVRIEAERTHFALPEGAAAWVTHQAQGTYARVPVAEMKGEAERPLTLQLPGGRFAAVAEARLVDYARMKLARAKDAPPGARSASAPTAQDDAEGRRVRRPAAHQPPPITPVSKLAGPVEADTPLTTPWRVIMPAERPGDLLEHNYLLLNLNPPCAIEDPSWIRPGKVIREVTLTTKGGKACVDFAAAHGLQYVEYDAGWYGHEYSDDADATTVSVDPKRNPNAELDLREVIRYARSKDIGILVYVNRRALERQLDEILPLYERWGVAGVKYGFVRVGSQAWTRWLHEAVRKAAAHHLVVDVHDNYRPTGVSRTWPNLMTQEGIAGNETMPDATHNTVLPFTRFVCGAGDYTICYYHNRIKTTHAHQLALAVCYYSPLQFVFWYDRPAAYKGEPEVAFFEHVPTVWDETRVVAGAIGEFAVIARRSGEAWYVGTITNNDGRRLEVPLAFLDAGRTYEAHIYEDARPEDEVTTRTQVRIRTRRVNRETVLEADLVPSGGQAVRLVPAKK
jgi:alpha-glucosidase